jgi:hypothetical protein
MYLHVGKNGSGNIFVKAAGFITKWQIDYMKADLFQNS